MSHNFRIPTFEDNPALGVQADGNGNMSPTLFSLEPRIVFYPGMIDLCLGSDSYGHVLETAVE